MKKVNFNLIPLQVEQGIITSKEAVNEICEFISLNPPVFGLQKYDEDFREELILHLLERGPDLMKGYDKSRGDFFTYLFYKIKSVLHSCSRASAKRIYQSNIKFSEEIIMEKDKEDDYNELFLSAVEKEHHAPFYKQPLNNDSQTPTTEELQKTFKNIHGDKKLLVIAIKSAYYITDNQVTKICKHYNINENDFFRTIQYCRNSLAKKAEKKAKLQSQRNYAYLNHKNLETQIYDAETGKTEVDNIVKEDFIAQNKKYYENWQALNKQLEAGILAVRPTNKTIASLLGICERQVAYYIDSTKAKKLPPDKNGTGK